REGLGCLGPGKIARCAGIAQFAARGPNAAGGASRHAQIETLVERATREQVGARGLAGAGKWQKYRLGSKICCSRIRCDRHDAKSDPGERGEGLSAAKTVSYSAGRIAKKVAELGRQITKDYRGRRIDAVVTLDRGFIFAADLLRQVQGA